MRPDREELTSNRLRGRQLLIGTGVAVVLMLVVVAGSQWCAGTEIDSGRRVVPAASADFADVEVVWAQRDQLHLDDTTIDLGAGRAEELTWTPHGVFVWMRSVRPRSYRLVYATSREVAEVGGRPGDIVVSADGRYAAWVDRDGPRAPMGPRAVLVVVDLRRGTEVLRSGAGMGGFGDDFADLYSELDPQALGFEGSGDELVVVYRNAQGGGEVVGLRVATGASAGAPSGPVGTPQLSPDRSLLEEVQRADRSRQADEDPEGLHPEAEVVHLLAGGEGVLSCPDLPHHAPEEEPDARE